MAQISPLDARLAHSNQGVSKQFISDEFFVGLTSTRLSEPMWHRSWSLFVCFNYHYRWVQWIYKGMRLKNQSLNRCWTFHCWRQMYLNSNMCCRLDIVMSSIHCCWHCWALQFFYRYVRIWLKYESTLVLNIANLNLSWLFKKGNSDLSA